MEDINKNGHIISRRKMVRLLGLSAASAAILAACGDSTATPAPANTTAAATTAAGGQATTAATTKVATTAAATTQSATTAVAQNVTGKVTLATLKGSTGTPKKIADTFNAKNTGVSIEYQEFPNDSAAMHDKFVTVLGAKDGTYDVIATDMPWAPEFAAAGYIAPLDSFVTPDFRKNFFEGSLSGATFKEKLYGIPWYQNIGVLFYRKDILDKAGLQPPNTFVELVDTATKLQTADIYGYVCAGFKNEGLSAMWLEVLWGFGGEYWDPATNKVLVDSPEAEASLQWLVDAIFTNKIIPEKMITFKGPDIQNVFIQGNAVFARGFADLSGAAIGADSKVKGLWGAKPVLAAQGKQASGCIGNWNLAVSASSKNPAAAWKAVEYLSSLEAQKAHVLGAGAFPALKAAFDDKEIQALNPAIAILPAAFANGKPRPVTPAYPQISAEVIQDQVSKVLSKQTTPKEAVKAMKSKTEDILAKFK